MAEKKQIDAAEIERIFALEEGPYLDLKHSDVSPAKLSRTVSAFANTSGGELFVGVGETRKNGKKTRFWSGLADTEAMNGIFQVLEEMLPTGGLYDATLLQCAPNEGYVLHLIIFKTGGVINSTDGIPYVRRGAQNLPVTDAPALQRLHMDKGIISFEDHAIKVPPDSITNSKTIISFVLNVVPFAEPEEWLRKQNLIAVDNQPTVAGLLLFADEPQAAIPKRSAIKIYRYKSKEEEGTRDTLAFEPVTIEGPIYDQIKEAVATTKGFIDELKTLAEGRLEAVNYPDETLHEIITNAVLHRDYSIASDVHVRIYDNRVEVESPGLLPGHITTQNILHEQSARNPKVVRLINKFPEPPNMDVGEGLNTAFEAMKRMKLKEPEIEEKDASVVVHIRHAPLAVPHDAVMEYLADHAEITNKIGRDLTGIRSENSMKDVFKQLQKKKIIEPVPGKRGNAFAWRKHTGYWESEQQALKDLFDQEI